MKLLHIVVFTLMAFTFSTNVMANDLTFDPTVEGQKVLTIVCTYNLERENGVPMVIGEIAKITFHVKKKGETDALYKPAGENTTACRQVYDMTQVPDGAYVYAAKEWDTDGRQSVYSTEVVNALVKRLPPSGAPTGMSGSRS